jgi:hypothetical protein
MANAQLNVGVFVFILDAKAGDGLTRLPILSFPDGEAERSGFS